MDDEKNISLARMFWHDCWNVHWSGSNDCFINVIRKGPEIRSFSIL